MRTGAMGSGLTRPDAKGQVAMRSDVVETGVAPCAALRPACCEEPKGHGGTVS
jgi:hypothetical protein